MDHGEIEHVFVYGSLKRGQPLYFLEGLEDLRLEVLEARMQGGLLYNLGPFPGMIRSPMVVRLWERFTVSAR